MFRVGRDEKRSDKRMTAGKTYVGSKHKKDDMLNNLVVFVVKMDHKRTS
jgi:hypothetical protein